MKLHNGHRAQVDLAKLRDFCLSTTHPRGRHKARVFSRKLGLTVEHAAQLRSALLAAATGMDATLGRQDDYGARYVLDFRMVGPGGAAIIRSHWMVRRGEDFPRLTSRHVW